ncbi:PQQ-binding-like beta-propeller repeat protein [Deinococcus sp.]|uniref:protein kinase domain-containing protein n=1 Tax=Deinococcus sp. TaxID=47478 RepID=UPI003CC68443
MDAQITGTVLAGRYDVGELLGEGGSAQVYRAHDTQLDRTVAVKIVHPHLPPMDRQRFSREIRTLARLLHPGVVAVYDLGEHLGRIYFTMPLLSGGAVTALGPLEDDPGQLGRYLTAAAFVARALQHVHDAGLIHRDLTPGNILLDGTGGVGGGTPRIMDFGLVALSEYSRHLTRSGVTLGTPQYMAPEQARGVGVSHASDLYALGAVLYRVACGSPPFVGDSDQSVLYQHVYDAPPDPRELNPAVPDALAQILLGLLAKTPAGRPASGEALAQQLELARRDAWARESRSQYRGGRQRGGVQPDGPLLPHLQAAWSTALPGEITWPSAVTGQDGLLAVGTRQGHLMLVSSGGSVQGHLHAGDEVTAPATLIGESVLYGAWDGVLRRSKLTGEALWSHRTRAEITGAATRWGSRILTTSRDGHLHAVNARSGELEWAYRAAGPIATSPLIWGGAAIIADEEGWVHAADAQSGAQLWRVQLQTVHATPALAHLGRGEAALLIPTWPGEVHALHLQLQSGHVRPNAAEPLLWTYDLEDEIWAAPAISGDTVILAGWSGKVRAVTLRGGDDLWSRQLTGRITASPVISGAWVYLATEAGELHALSLESGKSVWQARESVGIQATPLVSGGGLYVAFMDGTLRAYLNWDERTA